MCWNLEQCAKSAFPHLVAFTRVFQQSNGAGSYDPYILWSHNEYGLAISNPEEATWKEKQSTLSPKVMRTATTWWIFLEFCSCVCVCVCVWGCTLNIFDLCVYFIPRMSEKCNFSGNCLMTLK